MDLSILINNPIISTVCGTAILTASFFVIWVIIRALINVIFSLNNIDFVSNWIDDKCDKLQKKDKDTGKEMRAKLIFLANRIIRRLTENDGVN